MGNESQEAKVMVESKERFGVFARGLGLVMFVYGIYGAVHVILDGLGVRTRYPEPLVSGLVLTVLWFGLGAVLIFAADAIATIAYRSKPTQDMSMRTQ